MKVKEFIEKAILIHGYKYDYSNVVYLKCRRWYVNIICNQCNTGFKQRSDGHLQGKGCPNCSKINKGYRQSNTEEFISKAQKVYQDKYDYSRVVYIKSHKKVTIICPKHGEFKQSPAAHLCYNGCSKCGYENHPGHYSSMMNHTPNKLTNIYLIRCYNETEEFYKIGLSMNLKARLSSIPYNIEVISTYEGMIKDLYPIEQKYHKTLKMKKLKYKPSIDFGGRNECFNYLRS